MNLAKISANGQITLPADIRKLLGVGSGDKVLFIPKENGDIIISNAAAAFQPVSRKQFLDELEVSRNQAETGHVRDAKEAINNLRGKYGL